MVLGLLIVVASSVAEHRLLNTGLICAVHRLSCSEACGIFPDQGLNPRLLHWQVDSLPLSHQGSLRTTDLNHQQKFHFGQNEINPSPMDCFPIDLPTVNVVF